MFACFKSLRREISLMAVHGAPSSCSSLISFRATSLPVMLLRPLYTVAYVPCWFGGGGGEEREGRKGGGDREGGRERGGGGREG